jgi:hypothetical protein
MTAHEYETALAVAADRRTRSPAQASRRRERTPPRSTAPADADLTSWRRPPLKETMPRPATATFTVTAIPQGVADHVREHGRDPLWGHPAPTQVATGFGPCRLCLRLFREGEEERMLFTYDTYAGVSEFPQPGPVYIHVDDCPRYEADGFPPALRELKLTFEAVAPGPRVVALERTSGGSVEDLVAGLLDLPDVELINVRNTESGCFVARLEPRG